MEHPNRPKGPADNLINYLESLATKKEHTRSSHLPRHRTMGEDRPTHGAEGVALQRTQPVREQNILWLTCTLVDY